MTTTCHSSVEQVLSHHGIDVALRTQMIKAQLLATAISLEGRYRVRSMYEGLDHVFSVDLYSRHPEKPIWCGRRSMAAALPTQDSDELQGELAARDLGDIINALEGLLEEDAQ